MTYDQPLPSMRSLRKLASWDGPFPMKSYHMILGAQRYGFGSDMIGLLRQFPHDDVFRSRDDFINRCKELEIRIQSDRAPISSRRKFLGVRLPFRDDRAV